MPRMRDTMDGASDGIKSLGLGPSPNSTPASPSLLRFSEVPNPEVGPQQALDTTVASSVSVPALYNGVFLFGCIVAVAKSRSQIVAPATQFTDTATLANPASVSECSFLKPLFTYFGLY